MIDAYVMMSPAAMKVPVMLEEIAADYRVYVVNVAIGAQHEPDFRALSPNGKVPAIVDHDPVGGGDPVTLFESAAILLYLGEKSGMLLPHDVRDRATVVTWLLWGATGLAPMSGQLAHFRLFVPEGQRDYALDRYHREVNRLYGLLDRQLRARDFVCGDYSIADIGAYTWSRSAQSLGQDLADFPNMAAWRQRMNERPAVVRAYERVAADMPAIDIGNPVFRYNMFGRDAKAFLLD